MADIVEILTESTDVKQYIKRIRSRDAELNSRWGTICHLLKCLLHIVVEVYSRKVFYSLIKEENETITNCNQLKQQAEDGKTPNGCF